MDRKIEPPEPKVQSDNNNNTMKPSSKESLSSSKETSPKDLIPIVKENVKELTKELIDINDGMKGSKFSFSSSTTSSSTSIASSISITSNSASTMSNLFNTNHVPRKASKSDSLCSNQLPHKLKASPEHRKFSLSQLTSSAADRLMQRKSSLQPQTYHQLPHQTVLPNFMGLFLAEDQQLISNEKQISNKQTKSNFKLQNTKQESMSNYFQRKSSRLNHQNNNSTANLSFSTPNVLNRKKNSEPLLPGLLREEFFFIQCNLNAGNDDSNLQNLINEDVINEGENEMHLSNDSASNIMPSLISNTPSSLSSAMNVGSGKRRTALSSLITPNKSIETAQFIGLKSTNLGLQQTQQETSKSSSFLHDTSHESNNQATQTNFLNYLPFRRSKRAQSDPWIGERLSHGLSYSGNQRRFTLGTTTDSLFQTEEKVSCFI